MGKKCLLSLCAAAAVLVVGVPTASAAGSTCFGMPVTVYIGNGDVPTNGDDVIYGTAGDDVIDALGGNDVVCSLSGNDVVRGGSGNDSIFGGTGDDQLGGGAGTDTLLGGDGNDLAQGAAGNDTVKGGAGQDEITGGQGDDFLNGGAGDDKLAGNDGFDNCYGGPGIDQVVTCERTETAEKGTLVSVDGADLNALSADPTTWIDGDPVAPNPNANPAADGLGSGGVAAPTLEQQLADGDAAPGDQASNNGL
jgi:hypothetical protein